MKIISENKGIPRIDTEKYILRGMTVQDAPALFTFMSDSVTMRYITPHPVQSLEEMEEKITGYLENFQKAKEIPWVIVERKSGNVIGMFRFHKLHMWHRKAELGAAIHTEYQQTGVMTEVLKRMLMFGFQDLGLNRIVGDLFAENKGSKKLMEKFGFHKDGKLRQTDFDGIRYHDTIVYSMLKEEFDQLNQS
ncbi:GNAT family N-acetyltransferase [Bacillus sinesaloumensis]|uniref:GNAT family N-acetyltransferase n=1 Tax=Litchfieldia sinesaloumensis TaxID=1926280 RepID=UPI0009888FEE|nr:GNAT family N-acetyltransferase [Bacillus sinesaloumensis]